MANQSFPFCSWPPRSFPGCHFPGLSHGHRVYRGRGGLLCVDFSRPVGFGQAHEGRISLAGLTHAAPGVYTYVVRPVAGAAWLETPDLSNACEVVLDPDGQWLGSRPAGVEWLTARAESGGRITVRWSYRTQPGRRAAETFAVYCMRQPGPVAGEPSVLKDSARDGIYSHTFSLEHGESYWFTVTARAGAAESHMPPPIGPFVADASIPATPSVIVTRSF